MIETSKRLQLRNEGRAPNFYGVCYFILNLPFLHKRSNSDADVLHNKFRRTAATHTG